MENTFFSPTLKALALASCASVALMSAAPAQAGAGSSLLGGLVGGVIGGAIGSSVASQPRQERVIVQERRVYAPAQSSYDREQNRSSQEALNYFGFPAGVPDGIMGRRSRDAVGDYQAFMGFPVTGYLSDYDRSFLMASYSRAIAGGYQTQQAMAATGLGPRGILKVYYTNQTAGAAMVPQQVLVNPAPVIVGTPMVVANQPTPQTSVVINTAPAPAPQVVETVPAAAPAAPAAPAPQTQLAAVQAATPAAEAPTGMMPSFIGQSVEASMASFCNKTNLVTNSSGGMVTAASMTDVNVAVGEQFCLARTYVIDQGEQLSSTVQGVTLADMQAQCASFAPTMRDYVAGMVAKSPADETNDLQAFVIKTGMNPAQLAANARICLSIGYRMDNADVALASALVLVGLGESAYGEILGHHLANGFGVPKRLDRAADWYDNTAGALDGGAQRVVAPGATERPTLLRTAAYQLRGGAAASQATPAPQATALPTFAMPAPAAEATKISN
jgi:peptidoglycan hydrolase-like protein with peptidoglycan-binding domain